MSKEMAGLTPRPDEPPDPQLALETLNRLLATAMNVVGALHVADAVSKRELEESLGVAQIAVLRIRAEIER